MSLYICIFAGALGLSLMATHLAVRLARALGIVDAPGVRKVHRAPVPRVGGVAIVAATLTAALAAYAFDETFREAVRELHPGPAAMLAAGVFVLAVGLIDDVRGLRAGAKLAAEVAAAIGVCAFGIRIERFSVAGLGAVEFGPMASPVTILWIVGITNAVNLIDGLDGLAAGISAAACAVLAVLAVWTGQPVMAVLVLALLGALTGFLAFNFYPAKTFMGDCGSMFLGFTLATASVMCAAKSATLVGLGLPALALGLPIFDTFFSVIRRLLDRRSVFSPDRGHIHHFLLARGLRHRQAVMMMYAVTLAATAFGTVMMATRGAWSLVVFVGALLFLVLVFRLVGPLRMRRTLRTLKENTAMFLQGRRDRRVLERALLAAREAGRPELWWEGVCGAAGALDFSRVMLSLRPRGGGAPGRTLLWRRDAAQGDASRVLRVSVPALEPRSDSRLDLEVDVRVGPGPAGLEAAARRMMLFGRLIEDHGTQQVLWNRCRLGDEGRGVPKVDSAPPERVEAVEEIAAPQAEVLV